MVLIVVLVDTFKPYGLLSEHVVIPEPVGRGCLDLTEQGPSPIEDSLWAFHLPWSAFICDI